MDKKVTVLTPNGRRQNVKILPNTTLLQVLEEACQKHGFDSDEYCLTHHNREIDLSVPFRFSGLPNNALVEMLQMEKRRELADVTICLQLEDGSRVQGLFKPHRSLWDVACELSADVASVYASPVAIYMRQEVVGQEQMNATTLKTLGITEGRAMIRFVNKNPEELKIQANVYVPPKVKDTPKSDTESNKSGGRKTVAAGAGGFAVTKELMQSLKQSAVGVIDKDASSEEQTNENNKSPNDSKAEQEKEPEKPKYDWGTGAGHTMQTSTTTAAIDGANGEEEMDVEPEYKIIGDNQAILYSLDSTERAIEELPDSFYDLTVHDLKLVLRDLKRIATGAADAPLLTEKLRELEGQKTMLNKIGQYKNCVVRVQFPDRYILQGIFKPINTVAEVMAFVGKFLAVAPSGFHLFTIPPKMILSPEHTLLELDFVPTALVHFAPNDELAATPTTAAPQTFIAASFLAELTTPEGALFAANKLRIPRLSANTEMADNTSCEDMALSPPSTSAAAAAATTSALPLKSTGAIPKRPRSEHEAMARH